MLRKQHLPANRLARFMPPLLAGGLFPACCSPTRAVDDGVKAAAPAAAKNNQGDEADVTAPTPCNLRPETTTHVRSGQGSVDRAAQKSLGESLKKYPVDEVKEDLLPKASGSVGAPNTEPIPKTLDLVLVSAQPRPTTRRLRPPFQNQERMLLSGVKAEQPANAPYPAVSQLPVLRALVPLLLSFCALRETCAMAVGIKDTDGPPACVPCKQKGHTANYLDARVLQRDPPPERPCADACARSLGGIQLCSSGGWTA
ncbi:hypothetical protein EVAR_61530_1 [Eumeta japonica]|uniref:Uncharacterized protein n=1 Tax=Eumeta variegata TaxID=151549 RepID=A0A4C1YR00_EUMVA|nr:hypothetical protein EVAR_61530_1 [Eumeta japonica]